MGERQKGAIWSGGGGEGGAADTEKTSSYPLTVRSVAIGGLFLLFIDDERMVDDSLL